MKKPPKQTPQIYVVYQLTQDNSTCFEVLTEGFHTLNEAVDYALEMVESYENLHVGSITPLKKITGYNVKVEDV